MTQDKIIKILAKSLDDKNIGVRQKAVKSLGILNNKKTIPYLKKALEDEYTKLEASKYLMQLGVQIGDKPIIIVPDWNEYYPNLENATDEQRKFYYNWLSNLGRNNYLDIQGNLSYIFIYLYSIVNQFIKDKDIDKLKTKFNIIYESYSHYEKIKWFLNEWQSAAYYCINDYKNSLKYKKMNGLTWNDSLSYARFPEISEINYIDGKDLISLTNDKIITNFGKKYLSEIEKVSTKLLKQFYVEKGKTIPSHFINDYSLLNLSNKDLKNLKSFFVVNDQYNEAKELYFEWKNLDDEIRPNKKYGFHVHKSNGFVSVIDNTSKFDNISYSNYLRNINQYFVPQIIIDAFLLESQRILREAENKVRKSKNLPLVGEGWISETELFYKIKKTFSTEVVLHHGNPAWLGRQHLDIYFPDKNIGIEYQGDQHQRPVDYFGGEKNFKEQQKRDRRKKLSCQKNGCNLIYVYPEYDFEELKIEIMKYL